MKMRGKKILVLALALLMGLGLCACGVANFDDSGEFYDDLFGSSSQSQAEGLSAEKRQEVHDAYNELMNAYNEGSEEFAQAIEDEVRIPENLSQNYDAMGEEIDGYRVRVNEELAGMDEGEAEDFKAEMEKTGERVQSMRDELARAIEEGDSSASVSG